MRQAHRLQLVAKIWLISLNVWAKCHDFFEACDRGAPAFYFLGSV